MDFKVTRTDCNIGYSEAQNRLPQDNMSLVLDWIPVLGLRWYSSIPPSEYQDNTFKYTMAARVYFSHEVA
jgi:hypothetical protein